MRLFSLLLVCALLSACGEKETSRNLATSLPFQGYWLQQSDAEELRNTGRLDSLCAELRRDPAVIINARLIDAGGSVYAYNPAFGRVAEMLMGVVSEDGSFTPTPEYRQKMGITKGQAKFENSVLTFTYEFQSGLISRASMSYLRSSALEMQRYYAAQRACIP